MRQSDAWQIVLIGAFFFLIVAVASLEYDNLPAFWLCTIGAILQVGLGIIQIQIRKVW